MSMQSSKDGREPSDIFAAACETFRSSLTEDERKEFIEFADSETMLNSIRQEIASHPVHQSRLTMCCKKIASLADTLSPFFEIVEIFIQNNPRYVGLAWGAMRLVFHLGSNYISFLEKLSHMFEVIASKLSVYEEHARILQARAVERKQQVSIRLIKALAYIYSDIIQFCQYSCNLFAKRKDERIRELNKWVDPPVWLEPLQRAQKQRAPNTGQWIANVKAYKEWSAGFTAYTQSLGKRVLLIQGKPGYGKTTLCSSIIENLENAAPVNNNDSEVPMDVLYYFFEKQRKTSNYAGEAFRAILAQLLHLYRRDKQLIDIASLVWADGITKQSTATISDITSVLYPIFRQPRRIALVFDGIDECDDKEAFFEDLYNIADGAHNCYILLSGRPAITLPRNFSNNYAQIDLNTSQNLSDIERYLRPKFRELLDSGALGPTPNKDFEEIVRSVLSRANGMFLWVTLLVEYLQSPALNIHQRWDAIENLNRLEGLDALYGAILQTLQIRFPTQARLNIRRAFQWVARARRPLHVNELQTAIAIPASSPLEADSVIPNFEKSLGLMSGALLEVAADRTVRFIHLSVAEYLSRSTEAPNGFTERLEFEFAPASSELYLAICCLSYLCHTVTAEPLGGSCSVPPDASYTESRLPPLRYIAQHWSLHLSSCLNYFSTSDVPYQKDGSWQQLIQLTATFLLNRRKVTVWIEASWLFGNPPHIQLPAEEQRALCKLGVLSPSEGKLVAKAFSHLERWSADLKTLNDSWGHVLKASPNEIWEPSISAFTKSDFWLAVPGAKLTPITASGNKGKPLRSLSICSQVSANGQEVGSIRLINTDTQIRDGQPIHELFPRTSWKAIYEINSLQTNNVTCRFDLDLLQLFESPFRFPTAISSDLRTVVILGSVIKINVAGDLDRDSTLVSHCWLDFRRIVGKSRHNCAFKPAYRTSLSPSGKYLLVIHESASLVELDESTSSQLWFLDMYCCTNLCADGQDQIVHLASQEFFPPRGAVLDNSDGDFAFHPLLPQLAFARRYDTAIWDFSNIGQEHTHRVHSVPLEGLSFIGGNGWLFGWTRRGKMNDESEQERKAKRELVKIDLKKPNDALIADKSQHRSYPSRYVLETEEITNIQQTSHLPAAQRTNNLVLTQDARGMSSVSLLRQLESDGTIVLHSLREDGMLKSETLSRLPKSIASSSDAILLNPLQGEDSGTVRLVLNKSHQALYCNTDISNDKLPAILERSRASIPTVVGKRISLLGGRNTGSEDYQLKNIKRLMWHDGQDKRKRRRRQ